MKTELRVPRDRVGSDELVGTDKTSKLAIACFHPDVAQTAVDCLPDIVVRTSWNILAQKVFRPLRVNG